MTAAADPQPAVTGVRAVKDPTENHPDADRWIRRLVYAVVALVAAFAFLVSFTHIYDLGAAHGQHGIAAKLLPLSVDLVIVAASFVLWLQSRADGTLVGLARFLPRLMLWGGIGATVAANVAYGLPFGVLGAVISAWPGAVFAGLVEMVMVAVRPVRREPVNQTVIPAGGAQVPGSAIEAAKLAYAASLAGGNPLKETALASRFGISRSQARKILTPPGPEVAAMNGASSHE